MKPVEILMAILLTVFLCATPLVASQAAQAEKIERSEEHSVTTSQGYSGNVETKKYHKLGCRYFSCKKCNTRFSSPAEAQSKGYSPCKLCNE